MLTVSLLILIAKFVIRVCFFSFLFFSFLFFSSLLFSSLLFSFLLFLILLFSTGLGCFPDGREGRQHTCQPIFSASLGKTKERKKREEPEIDLFFPLTIPFSKNPPHIPTFPHHHTTTPHHTTPHHTTPHHTTPHHTTPHTLGTHCGKNPYFCQPQYFCSPQTRECSSYPSERSSKVKCDSNAIGVCPIGSRCTCSGNFFIYFIFILFLCSSSLLKLISPSSLSLSLSSQAL